MSDNRTLSGRERRFSFDPKEREGRRNLALFTAFGVLLPKRRQRRAS